MATNLPSAVPANLKCYVCRHVFDNVRPILYVCRPDGDWCFMCGDDHPDESDSYRVVGIGHVAEDSTILEVLDLEVDEQAERAGQGEPWARSAI